jgi:hypothetical protein
MKALNFVLLATVLVLFTGGCKTTDPENVAERPWNSQRGWEHGLPSTINQGR